MAKWNAGGMCKEQSDRMGWRESVNRLCGNIEAIFGNQVWGLNLGDSFRNLSRSVLLRAWSQRSRDSRWDHAPGRASVKQVRLEMGGEMILPKRPEASPERWGAWTRTGKVGTGGWMSEVAKRLKKIRQPSVWRCYSKVLVMTLMGTEESGIRSWHQWMEWVGS